MLSPRWLALHAVTVLLAAAFLMLGWWQLRRGESGNLRSYAYALEWPLFALFTVFMWWHLIRDGRPPAEGAGPERPASRVEPDPAPEPALPRVLASRVRPGRAAGDTAGDRDEETDERLAAYNRYLADLRARDEQRAR
ncbi:MAG TPA: hypothetical protein VFX70_14475 [Mycobacteriales bacterium]|nr:hypothetical protein [Mycobacteriales bacterium]